MFIGMDDVRAVNVQEICDTGDETFAVGTVHQENGGVDYFGHTTMTPQHIPHRRRLTRKSAVAHTKSILNAANQGDELDDWLRAEREEFADKGRNVTYGHRATPFVVPL